MNKLIETAKEIDRILKSGIEIHPNSPIHEKLQQALNLFSVINNEVAVCDCAFVRISDNVIECTKCGDVIEFR